MSHAPESSLFTCIVRCESLEFVIRGNRRSMTGQRRYCAPIQFHRFLERHLSNCFAGLRVTDTHQRVVASGRRGVDHPSSSSAMKGAVKLLERYRDNTETSVRKRSHRGGSRTVALRMVSHGRFGNISRGRGIRFGRRGDLRRFRRRRLLSVDGPPPARSRCFEAFASQCRRGDMRWRRRDMGRGFPP